MENILQKLLVSDNKVIQEGTKELKESFKSPEAIPALCQVLVSSNNAQVRQTAAVVLRRRLGKKHQWNKLDVATRASIKQGMLQALINEQEKLVKNSIAQFMGLIGRYEFESWPEIMQFLQQFCSSDKIVDKELGMFTLSIMTESPGTYLKHPNFFIELFSTHMQNVVDINVAYYCIKTMDNLVVVIEGQPQVQALYRQYVPRTLQIIAEFSLSNEKRACDLFEFLENLIEYSVNCIVPHVRSVVEMCLNIANNREIETSVQIKAVSVIGWLIRSKSKVVQKNKLVEPIIDVLLLLMSVKPEDDVNEEYFLGNPDQFTATTIAAQTLDLIALNVPPEKVVPFLLTRVEPALQGNDIYAQKAAYLALAVLAEGCADHIRSRYLESFLKCVYNGIKSPSIVVRNAAFFALGQFSEHLQPQISEYAKEILPVFFDYLTSLFAEMERTKTEPSGLDRMFYALQSFCLHLDDSLLPYIPVLMDKLLVALDPGCWSMQLKRLALSTLDSVACAIKAHILPYFERIIQLLMVYINAEAKPEVDTVELQSYAIECVATLAENVGAEHFKPLAEDCLVMAMKIMETNDDPDIRKSVYSLMGALSTVMGEDFSHVLPKVVEQMISTLKSTEGIVATCDEDEKEAIDVYDDLSDSEAEEDIDGDGESECSDSSNYRYTVENSYNDEKEQACVSLMDISKNMGPAFLPYLQPCFEEIFKLVNYPQEDIRSAAISALEQFCLTLGKIETAECQQALQGALQVFIPKCAELIRADEESQIVITATNVFTNLLDELGAMVLVGEGHREAIMNCVVDLLNLKTMCQDTDAGGAGDTGEEESCVDDGESEQTELLLECAGDVIPKFGRAITPEDFRLYFPNILTLLSFRMSKQNSLSQRSFSYGTLAECMKPLGFYIDSFKINLLQIWHTGCSDKSDEVRNNAVFGLGEMVLYGRDCIFPFYKDILQKLSDLMSKEQHAGTMDNICGALAKMIIVNHNNIPLEQVFPVLLQHLPLKTDFEENVAIVNCFIHLYREGVPIFLNHIREIIKITAHIYHNRENCDTCNSDDTKLLVELVKKLNSDFPQEFAEVVPTLGPEATSSFQQLLSTA